MKKKRNIFCCKSIAFCFCWSLLNENQESIKAQANSDTIFVGIKIGERIKSNNKHMNDKLGTCCDAVFHLLTRLNQPKNNTNAGKCYSVINKKIR